VQAYDNKVNTRSGCNACRLIQESEGYKQRCIVSAEGDARHFEQILVEYSKAPTVTRERLYLDMMQQVLSNTSKILVDQKSGNNLLYLPLDKLIQMTGSTPASPVAVQSSAQESAPDSSIRARESFRSREREIR